MRASVAHWLGEARARPPTLALAAAVTGMVAGPRSALMVVVGCAAAVLAMGRRGVAALALVAAVLGGAVAADARLAALDAPAAGVRDGASVRGDAVLLDAPRRWATGELTATVRLGDRRLLLRARDGVRWPAAAREVGAVVEVGGTTRRLRPRDGWLRVRGVHATLFADRVAPTGRRRGGVAGAVDGVRRRAERALTAGVPAQPSALLRGMALGQDAALPEAVREDFRSAGLSHLVAASGANVVLLASLALAFGAVLGIGLRARLLLVLGLIAVYVPLAGDGPSIRRAGVMGAAGVIALLAGRPSHRWHALLLAAAVTLAVSPRAVEDPGWQLSFAAVLGILLFAPRLRDALRRRRAPAALAEAIAVTAAATLATAPLVTLHFDRTSLVALPANVLVAPAVAPVTWLAMVAAAVGQVVPAAAAVPATLAAIPAAFIEAVAHVAARVPHAEAQIGLVVVIALCCAIAAGVAVRRARGPLVVAVVLAAGLWLAVRPPAPAPPAGPRLSVLDVGQGDAILLQAGRRAMLVDTGPPAGPVLDRLRAAGIRRLDALVLTHAQADHLGAAARILDAVPVGTVLDGRDGVREPAGARMAIVAARRGVRRVAPVAGAVVRDGPLSLEVLWPPPGRPPPGADPNERAVVARARVGTLSVLLTSDAESGVLDRLDLGQIDVLKVSHHGSADPGLPGVLERLRPRVAVVSVGAGNSYGHPAAGTLAALRASGAAVHRTDREGTVVVEPAGGGLRVGRGS